MPFWISSYVAGRGTSLRYVNGRARVAVMSCLLALILGVVLSSSAHAHTNDDDFNVRHYGAKGGNLRVSSQGSLNGTIFRRGDDGSFVAADVGKTIIVLDAGAGMNAYQGTIVGFINAKTVTIKPAPTSNVVNKPWDYGWDDTPAVQACLTAAGDAGRDCAVPDDSYLITSGVYLGNPAGRNVAPATQIIGVGNGVTKTFASTLKTNRGTKLIERDAVFVYATNTIVNQGKTVFVDEDENGTGTFLDAHGKVIGMVDYTSGGIKINFPLAPAQGASIMVSYYLQPVGDWQQSAKQAGLHGGGSWAAYFDCTPSVTGYCFAGQNVDSKSYHDFNIESALDALNQRPFGGLNVAGTNGAPSARNRFFNISVTEPMMIGFNFDLQNDSLIEADYAVGASYNNSYGFTFNGNGGPMTIERIFSDRVVTGAGQNFGVYNSGLYGGIRFFSSDDDAITIDNTQLFQDPMTNDNIDTLTGVCNQGVAQSLSLNNDLFAGPGAAIAGHFWEGGIVQNTLFFDKVFGTLDQHRACNAAVPLFKFYSDRNNSGLMGADSSKVHWQWCQDGVSNCTQNYDDLASSATTFTGIGRPPEPQVIAKGTIGVTTYRYYQVDVGRNSLDTIPSAPTNLTIGNSTLNAGSFNLICPSYNAGAIRYKILKGNTATLLGIVDNAGYRSFSPLGRPLATCLKDTGQGTSAYRPQTIDQTAIMNPDSPLTVGLGGFAKQRGAPAGPVGAGMCETFVVAGTRNGTCKLQMICGTSATPVTIVDNVGAGC